MILDSCASARHARYIDCIRAEPVPRGVPTMSSLLTNMSTLPSSFAFSTLRPVDLALPLAALAGLVVLGSA
ncbi:hypothetical protein FB451DRAFT_1408576 [Mycena latifolia]|nr:hypothetical protein FB451DRAFT_1408576 [Mycena latifolia]